MIYKLVTCQ